MDNEKITVSVIIPCRNEVLYIEKCLENIFSFDPPSGGFEVLVIDGMSDDGTLKILGKLKERYPDLTILSNPKRTVPHAMNTGILHARGEYIVRADVRCVHPRNYLTSLIGLCESTVADNVGGILDAVGNTYIQKSIATAYRSPIAVGGALRRRENFKGESDDVYGGCFRRERLLSLGMYDESMTRNQDDELSFRLRKAGGKIIQSGAIRIQYFPRSRFGQLFKQFLQYGYWKIPVIRKHPAQASWRHFAPALLVLGFIGLVAASFFFSAAVLALSFYGGLYLFSLFFESLRITWKDRVGLLPGVITAIGCMHLGFGIGFILGLSQLWNHRNSWFETLSR